MDRIPSSLLLPIMAGVFVLIVGGGLGALFTVAAEWTLFSVGKENITGTVLIGLIIVVLAPVVGGLLYGKRNSNS